MHERHRSRYLCYSCFRLSPKGAPYRENAGRSQVRELHPPITHASPQNPITPAAARHNEALLRSLSIGVEKPQGRGIGVIFCSNTVQ